MEDFSRYNKIAFSSPRAIRKLQERIFKQHFRYCVERSPYYRKAFGGKRINLKNIALDRIAELPFTDKADIERSNDDFLAVPLKKIVDIVLSSGTTGKPIRVMYTERDLKRLAYNEKESFRGAGLTADDKVLLTCTIDRCFVAGLAYFLGIRSLGAAAIRNGLNSLESHAEIIKRLKPTAIVGVPTFIRKLGIFLKDKGIEPKDCGISKIVCIAEPLRDKNLKLLLVGQDLEKIWAADVFSTYATSEIVTTFCECTSQQGGHFLPDLAIVEIVDDKNRILPIGSIGEVVVTPLAVRGMPLVRFKTGDVSFLIDEPCACGRFSIRLGPILGRKKQMMKVRGTTIYPQAIYSALEEIDRESEYYISVTSASDLSDHITVNLALKHGGYAVAQIEEMLQSRLRFRPSVIIESEEVIKKQVYDPQFRKPTRFLDRRSLKR